MVLVDGLDHVWRDNARDKRPLDEIFHQLLPIFGNMVLLVGTQPVDGSLLPDILLNHSPKSNWQTLPTMTGKSIYDFLKFKINSNRLHLDCSEDYSETTIKESANKLQQITNGYPLHVIYSIEYLAQNGKYLSEYEVEKLPPCTSRDINTYYLGLWNKLSHKQKDVLILCAGFQFSWPRPSIAIILDDDTEQPPNINAVSHMLFEGLSGIRPFHESLVVFVKEQDCYQERINTLLPSVCNWLKNEASEYLKDAWLWSCLARSGDSSELRQGVSRDWILDYLIRGMPIKTCLRLLSEAENIRI